MFPIDARGGHNTLSFIYNLIVFTHDNTIGCGRNFVSSREFSYFKDIGNNIEGLVYKYNVQCPLFLEHEILIIPMHNTITCNSYRHYFLFHYLYCTRFNIIIIGNYCKRPYVLYSYNDISEYEHNIYTRILYRGLS